MRVILIFFVCLMVFSMDAQTLLLKDKQNGQPVMMAWLADENKRQARTDTAGQVDISAFRGARQIRIEALGYEPATVSYVELRHAGFVYDLTPAVLSLNQVVVSASRWNQALRETPARVTAIAPATIALQNPQTAADLLGATGEVFIQKSQQGGGSPMIRGFATNRLLISVDGVRMNNAIFRSGNLQNVISLDPFAMARAEVLFGPGSVMYGSDAIGGVMRFETLSPEFSTEDKPLVNGDATLRYSSANHEQTGHLHFGLGWKKWALLTSVSHNRFGDLRMGSQGPRDYLRQFYVQRIDDRDSVFVNPDPEIQRNSGYEQTNLMQKVRYRPNARWDIAYGFHYSTTSDYDRYDRLLRLRNGKPRSAEWYYGPQMWMKNHLNVRYKAGGRFFDEWQAYVAQQRFEESRHDRNLNAAVRFNRTEQVQAYSAGLDLVKTVGRVKLLYGVEAIYNDIKSTGTDENIITGELRRGPARYPQSIWGSYAVYAGAQYKLSRKLMLQAGARYNDFVLHADFDTTFYPFPYTRAELNRGALTGSLGLAYNPDERWSARANLSSGFRSPNVDDLGKVFESTPGAVIVPNPGLQAEYAYNAELGLAHVLAQRVKVDLSAYYTLLDNALVRRNFTLNGRDSIVYAGEMSRVEAVQNAARASVWGVQAGVEVKLPGRLGIVSHFTYQNGEEELEDGSTAPLRHAAPWFGVTRLTYTRDKLQLDLNAQYSGAVPFEQLAPEEREKDYLYAADADGKPYAPDWYTLNFKGMYRLSPSWSISLGVENITDQRYRPYSSGLAGAGRNIVAAVRAGF